MATNDSVPDLPLPAEDDTATAATEEENVIQITDDGGLSKKIMTPGSGPTPKSGDKLKVHYTGTLLSGKQFDSSRDRGEPFEFKVGVGQVIKGWDQGMVTMQRGERSIFTIREDYGYGKSGSGATIPPGATLVFDVEMIDFDSPEPLPHELSASEKVDKAKTLKAEGNVFFVQKSYSVALAKYEKALTYTAKEKYPAPGEDEGTEDQATELAAIQLSCNLNSAQANICLKEYKSAINFCDEVLDSAAGKDNVKALYRRGVAHAGTGDIKAAFKDLAAALKLAPNDKSVKKKIKAIRKKVQAQKKKEKKAYGGFFNKLGGGMYGDKKKKDAAPEPSSDPEHGSHGHSHGGEACHGHGTPIHIVPPEESTSDDAGESHGHSHGDEPCHGHGAPSETTSDDIDGSHSES